MGLTAKLPISLNITNTKDLDLNTVRDVLDSAIGISFTDGTAADQAEILWHDQRSTDDTGETLDLYASGTIVDAFGDALTLTKLKVLIIKNTHATLSLWAGAAATTQIALFGDPASDKLLLPPGGIFLFTAPGLAGVDTATNKSLKIACTTAATVTYDIYVIGVD